MVNYYKRTVLALVAILLIGLVSATYISESLIQVEELYSESSGNISFYNTTNFFGQALFYGFLVAEDNLFATNLSTDNIFADEGNNVTVNNNLVVSNNLIASDNVEVANNLTAFMVGANLLFADVVSAAVTDNVSFLSDATFGGDVLVLGNLTGNLLYGEMWNDTLNGSVTLLIGKGNFTNITGLIAGSTNGMQFAEGGLVALRDGTYKIDYGVSFAGGNSDDYKFTVGVNGAGMNGSKCTTYRTTSNNALGNTGTSCILSLSFGDLLTLMVQDYASGAVTDPEIVNVGFTVQSLGD